MACVVSASNMILIIIEYLILSVIIFFARIIVQKQTKYGSSYLCFLFYLLSPQDQLYIYFILTLLHPDTVCMSYSHWHSSQCLSIRYARSPLSRLARWISWGIRVHRLVCKQHKLESSNSPTMNASAAHCKT